MSGDRRGSDLAGRLNVKRGGKLTTRTSKHATNPISSPPRAAIAASSTQKDEVHRRRHPLNEILRHQGPKPDHNEVPSPPLQNVELGNARSTEVPDLGNQRSASSVADLERALAIASADQDALRQELDRLRHERNIQIRQTAETTESHHPPGYTQRGEEEEHHIIGRSDELPTQEAHDFRRHRTEQSQHAMYHDHIAHSEIESNDLRTRLHAVEKESEQRLQQLLSLKSSISFLTRTDSQTTDSELTESFSQLANRIREWVISNYRRTKLDIKDLPAGSVKVLQAVTPSYQAVKSTDRFAFYQAIVSSAILPVFEEPVLLGLRNIPSLNAIEQFATSFNTTSASAMFRDWRRATIRLIEESTDRHEVQSARDSLLLQIARDLEHVLFTLTSVSLTPSAQAALHSILNTAAELQRTLVLQKAQYRVLLFRDDAEGTKFDEQRMESLDDNDVDEDGDVYTEHKYFFCVSPCLEKFGDEWGQHTDVSNILLKARVCCGVG